REPYREVAGVVLDEDGDEALERSVDGSVDHHRPVLLVVLADVAQVESLRRVVVELDGPELPLASDAVLDVEVQLGPVKGSVARVLQPGDARLLDGRAQARLGAVPQLVAADAL